jgi:hypothetical protein
MRRRIIPLLVAAGVLAGAAPANARTLVRYERTGGFAGFDDAVTVSTGGAVKVARRTGTRHFSLSHARLAALRKAVRDARFGTLKARYAPPSMVADGIRETVRHDGRSVTVETGGNPPARVRRLLDRLSRLMSGR